MLAVQISMNIPDPSLSRPPHQKLFTGPEKVRSKIFYRRKGVSIDDTAHEPLHIGQVLFPLPFYHFRILQHACRQNMVSLRMEACQRFREGAHHFRFNLPRLEQEG